MRRTLIALAAGAALALPASASADVVVGAGVLNAGPTPNANVLVNAGVNLGPATPLGVTVSLAVPSLARNVGVVKCLRAEGKQASMVVRFIEPVSDQQGTFVGQVFWFDDRGLLGLLGPVDRGYNFRLKEAQLAGEFATCPPVTPPAIFGYRNILLGDFTVLDI